MRSLLRRGCTTQGPASWVQPKPVVIILLPTAHNKLMIKCQGLYPVIRWVGEVDYEIKVPGKGPKLFHANLLKVRQSWQEVGQYRVEWNWPNLEEDGEGWTQRGERRALVGLASTASMACKMRLSWDILRESQDVWGLWYTGSRQAPREVVQIPICPIPRALKRDLDHDEEKRLELKVIEESKSQ